MNVRNWQQNTQLVIADNKKNSITIILVLLYNNKIQLNIIISNLPFHLFILLLKIEITKLEKSLKDLINFYYI